MKEININIEGYNVNGICVGCLNYGRKMFYRDEVKECFRYLADIDVPDGLTIQVCWECLANVRTVNRFQAQVLRSYDVLIEYSQKHTFLNSPADLSQYAYQRLSAFHISKTEPTSLVDDDDKTEELEVKVELEDDKFEIEFEEKPLIKAEGDDNQDSQYSDQEVSQGVTSDEDIQLSQLKKKKKEKKSKRVKKEGRKVFSDLEKSCLIKLITKYKLNTASTIGAGNINFKRNAWIQLVEEYNSIETNCKRTEAQLKKCWDNLKSRRKQMLAIEKKERMRTRGGPYSADPGPSSSNDATIDDSLQDQTDVEMRFVIDSDGFGESQAARNIRAAEISKEFELRKENYVEVYRREEELHQIKIVEQEWLVKAAKEKFRKAQLERKNAEEILKFSRLKREQAESELNKK